MQVYQIGCQGCNNSCPLEVTVENRIVIKVEGNCCHRGPMSAETQMKKKFADEDLSSDGIKEMICPGCSNACLMKVTMKDGEVLEVTDHGCRRGIMKAKQKLERK